MNLFVGNSIIPAVLMAEPYSIINSKPNNIWMQELVDKDNELKIDVQKCEKQFFDLQKVISQSVRIMTMPTTNINAQDLMYTANSGMVFPHLKANDNRILLSRFKSEPRKCEEPIIKDFYINLGYDVVVMPEKNEKGENLYFEGEADLKYLYDNVYIGAYGIRTNSAALDWISKEFGCKIIKFPSNDEYLYHLDCNVLPLGSKSECALINTYNLDKKVISEIEKHVEIIPLGVDDFDDKDQYDFALSGLTNSVLLPGNILIMPSDITELNKKSDKDLYEIEKDKIEFMDEICSELCIQLIVQNISGFYSSGASLSCLVQHLNKASFI